MLNAPLMEELNHKQFYIFATFLIVFFEDIKKWNFNKYISRSSRKTEFVVDIYISSHYNT